MNLNITFILKKPMKLAAGALFDGTSSLAAALIDLLRIFN